ncbi:MAG: DNA topoisomerase III [Sutterellaceae bacterium]|nr:DNA topoisomerase III [Burkholderiaceae bacterium]MCX7900857.1 DNA topoisomerase III [Burkholderiaceae bacterium]MDW8429286.1 DNA topoisomerase III [Sutterellaceae bacterium]
MGKALIIAEKPSVAADIARALGGFTKHGDYYESDRYVLSSAVGHLLELKAPDAYEVKRGKWSFAHLPVIPPHFELQPIEKAEARLKLLAQLIRRKDVTTLINACDAGREGELIFRYIVQYTQAKQPIRRLWLQSMTPAAIREAFTQLRADEELLPLADAARCRAEADWLVGINGTRAMTAFNSKDGGFFLTTVGRVQTPTLAIVVEREEKIQQFVPRDYWEVRAVFACAAGTYEGRWFDPAFSKREDDPDARAERLWDAAQAQAIVVACGGQAGTVSEEAKPSTQAAPLLFDLTSLQREANARFGFSAKTTLALAQALYERHKVLTYPRTDARALPEDYLAVAKATVQMVAGLRDYAAHAQRILDSGWIRPNKRVFDNSKVSDHFAIIPTLQPPKHLTEAEQKIYDLVVKRFLAVFFPPAEYLVTTRITTVAGQAFRTEGKVLVEPGWLAVYGRQDQQEQDSLPPLQTGEQVHTQHIEAVGLQTKPPPRFTEATLLSAMEGAGKLVEDEELRAAMAGKGLGTPATRAQIIEGLIAEKYLVRDGRELHPTAKAFQLLRALRGFGVDDLDAPELTGEWEYKLSLMERGKLKRETFMREIARMTQDIVERIRRGAASGDVPGEYATLKTPCPNCGGRVVENYRRFACTQCDFSIPKHPGGRFFEINEVEQLLRERQIGPLTGFRSRQGRPFSAVLKLTPEHKLEFDFGTAPAAEEPAQAADLSGQSPLGPCPKCGAAVYEQPMSYVCEKAVGATRSCDFRSSKVILQQPVEAEQMRKLLAQGRTDLLRGFVSNRTRRKFAAFLVRKPDGSIGFEFEARGVRTNAAAEAGQDSIAAAEEPPAPRPGRKTAARTAAPAHDAAEEKPATAPTRRRAAATGVESARPAKKATHTGRGGR